MSLISALLIATAVAWAQPNEESTLSVKPPEPPAPTEERPREKAAIFLNTEIRYLSTDTVQRRALEGGKLYELSTRMRFEPESTIGVSIDAGVEQFKEESGFLFRKVELDFRPIDYVELRAGQTFIPLGFFAEDERWMAELPHYYNVLLPWEKGIDLGARAMVRPFANDYLILDAATYSGRTVRPGDDRPGPAESRPTIFQLRSEGIFWSAFAAQWSHDLAYRDRIEAQGLGLSLKYRFEELDLEPMVQFEGFAIEEKQKTGPMQTSRAGSFTAQLRWNRLMIGGLYGQSRREATVNRETYGLDPVFERNLYGEVFLHKTFRIRGERRTITDGEQIVDDMVWRAIFDVKVL